MQINEQQQDFNALGRSIEEFAEEALAITSDERFVSIPERCQRAGELALELAGLLGGISSDTKDMELALAPFSYEGKRYEALVERATSVVAGSSDKDVKGIPHRIAMIGISVSRLAETARECEGRVSQYPRLAERLDRGSRAAGKSVKNGTEWMVESVQSDMAVINSAIQGHKL